MLLAGAISLVAQSRAIELTHDGDEALAFGRYYEAVEAYRGALDENPNSLQAVVGLAEAYYQLGEYDQAERYVDRAERLARTNTQVINLSGSIAIGRGDLAAAEASFARVQQLEPNNVDAAIGRAELALAQGRSVEAASRLERALQLNPDHRKALLSLILVYEYLGEDEIAQRYLELALSVHRDRPEVHVLAAEYYARAGDSEAASRSARTAQAIDPSNRAARTIRAELAIAQESYLEAATIAEELIGDERSDVRAWYLRAVARYRLGELDTALTSIRTALRAAPDNETLRIWAEWVATRELDLEHPVRRELASARADDAARLERGFRYDRALKAYRRALRLAPLDLDLRRSYAELFRRMGYNASYLQELRVIRENGEVTEELDRIVEVYENALSGSVSARWGIDQFTIDRGRTPVGLFLVGLDGYAELDDAVLDYVGRTLGGLERVTVSHAQRADGYATAFSVARSHDVDFFIQVTVALTDRLSAIAGDVHVGRTGARATRVGSVRTGPDHSAAAVDAFADEVARAVPVRGAIVRRRGDRVVVDLGTRDGLRPGSEFLVLRGGDVTIASDEPSLLYRRDRVIGTVTITAVDDLIAEGTLEASGVVGLVGAGDVVVPVVAESESETDAETASDDLFPVLYARVRALR